MTRKMLLATSALVGLSAMTAFASAQGAAGTGFFDNARFYVGAHAGGAWGDGDNDLGIGSISSDFDGVIGVLTGVDFMQGNFLFGLEGDIGFGNRDIRYNGGGCVLTLCGTDVNGHLRGRIGFVVMDNLTLFAAGGLAIASFDKFGSGSSTEFGWTIGAGGQYSVNSNWDVRIEYLRDEYRDINSAGYVHNDWSDNTVRAAAIFKF